MSEVNIFSLSHDAKYAEIYPRLNEYEWYSLSNVKSSSQTDVVNNVFPFKNSRANEEKIKTETLKTNKER